MLNTRRRLLRSRTCCGCTSARWSRRKEKERRRKLIRRGQRKLRDITSTVAGGTIFVCCAMTFGKSLTTRVMLVASPLCADYLTNIERGIVFSCKEFASRGRSFVHSIKEPSVTQPLVYSNFISLALVDAKRAT